MKSNFQKKIENESQKPQIGIKFPKLLNEGGYGTIYLTKNSDTLFIIKENDDLLITENEKKMMKNLNH